MKDMKVIKSKILNEINSVRYIFATRMGGVSEDKFKSLNFSYTTGDNKKNVEKNIRILAAMMALPTDKIIWADQVHEDKVLFFKSTQKVEEFRAEKADSIITGIKGAFIGVKTADCCPIFIVDENNSLIGVVHSGWKGTIKQILKNAIIAICSEGAEINNIKVIIGPSIGSCCYSVNEERINDFSNVMDFCNDYITTKNNKIYLDLQGINSRIAMSLGVRDTHIEIIRECTACNEESLFSYRRDGQKSGRQFSGIMLI